MKIVHIESGLGNQMLSYCEYLAISKMNPYDKCYVETMVYDIPECNDTICQWNGYELERVFGVKAPNIRVLFDDITWHQILKDVRASEFWRHQWNWPVAITKALNNAGLNIVNSYGDRTAIAQVNNSSFKGGLKKMNFTDSRLGVWLRGLYYRLTLKKRIAILDQREKVFVKTNQDLLTGQRLCFKYRGNDIEQIKEDIEKTFVFPPLEDERSIKFCEFLDSCNSVFIHARRGDMLSANGWCYKYGYFRRAVKHIKKNVKDPVFVFFTNTGSIEWCKENAKTFGLDYSRDKVYFVDWNIGEESYRDMQLMSHCKHGIITNSTFGWWGAYFIKNPDKITISPELTINTTYHC